MESCADPIPAHPTRLIGIAHAQATSCLIVGTRSRAPARRPSRNTGTGAVGRPLRADTRRVDRTYQRRYSVDGSNRMKLSKKSHIVIASNGVKTSHTRRVDQRDLK
jgi:hypothetical protein